MNANLLVELFTEELPPNALKKIGETFAREIRQGLIDLRLVTPEQRWQWFATPRRLAIHIQHVAPQQLPRVMAEKLVPVSIAFDADGKPTQALLKKLQAKGLREADIPALERRVEGKTETLFFQRTDSGFALEQVLGDILVDAFAKLPVPKVMNYQLADGATTVQFVRPVHGIVALHGSKIVPVSALGLKAGRITQGHRFLGAKDIHVATADAYEEALAAHGKVIASFDDRRTVTEQQLRAKATELKASLGPEADVALLLDEVTALVEYPTVYVGEFEFEFLSVPQECLILTMRANQKYFPLFDEFGKLTNKFLIVSNMRLEKPKNIVEGNQRVVRPRLADARFFFETDKKIKLDRRVQRLASVTYHNRIGNQLERVERIRKLAVAMAGLVGADAGLTDRAALLAKADLVTNMVGEFPELQGVMGHYYALADGESPIVAEAVEQHYWPRFSGDKLPTNDVGACVSLADKLISIVGIFGIGEAPSGEKDPYALRRSALGFIRILIERGISLDARQLIDQAAQLFIDPKVHESSANYLRQDQEQRTKHEKGAKVFAFGHVTINISEGAKSSVYQFILERLRGYLRDRQYTANEIEAVLALRPNRIDQVVPRIDAVRAFAAMPEAESLASANKRIGNILKKADSSASPADSALFVEPSEKALAERVKQIGPDVEKRFAANDYAGTLKLLAQMKQPVDTFFNDVMVMAEDPKLRANRIALLRELHGLMNRVADISKLAA
ncbi:MAG: glycine--tRNA ligase subunit beta [Betaproteobacteria bacterium]|nr:MAG: glycine--tRNA ligase subunit beta [Betaproteobacteria bacterium]